MERERDSNMNSSVPSNERLCAFSNASRDGASMKWRERFKDGGLSLTMLNSTPKNKVLIMYEKKRKIVFGLIYLEYSKHVQNFN